MVLIHQLPAPAVGVHSQTANVEALIGESSHGKGTLYVTEAIMSWINGISGEGFNIPYKKMALHAVSRDPAVHPSYCLYVMVNGSLEEAEAEEELDEPQETDCDEETTEIRFVPDDSSVLDAVYKAVQDCTLLHPDPSSDMSGLSEEEEEEDANEAFEGFVPAAAGAGDGNGVDDDDYDYYQDQQRQIGDLQAYLRSRLQLGHGAGHANALPHTPEQDDVIGSPTENGNQAGSSPPFDPDQFADA